MAKGIPSIIFFVVASCTVTIGTLADPASSSELGLGSDLLDIINGSPRLRLGSSMRWRSLISPPEGGSTRNTRRKLQGSSSDSDSETLHIVEDDSPDPVTVRGNLHSQNRVGDQSAKPSSLNLVQDQHSEVRRSSAPPRKVRRREGNLKPRAEEQRVTGPGRTAKKITGVSGQGKELRATAGQKRTRTGRAKSSTSVLKKGNESREKIVQQMPQIEAVITLSSSSDDEKLYIIEDESPSAESTSTQAEFTDLDQKTLPTGRGKDITIVAGNGGDRDPLFADIPFPMSLSRGDHEKKFISDISSAIINDQVDSFKRLLNSYHNALNEPRVATYLVNIAASKHELTEGKSKLLYELLDFYADRHLPSVIAKMDLKSAIIRNNVEEVKAALDKHVHRENERKELSVLMDAMILLAEGIASRTLDSRVLDLLIQYREPHFKIFRPQAGQTRAQ